jgi:NDP-sugar pyrophosphorylase family protein
MKAVILVGGEGTRLRPLTLDVPKPLLPVANVPFVERTLRRLAAVGCTEVVLSTCYRSEAFDRFADHAEIPVRIVVESEPLGTGGAIGFAARGFDDTFLVLNGDVLTDLDLGAVIDVHRRSGAEATIVLTPVDDPSRFGVVPTAADGRVERFIEKPAPGTAPTNMINAGTYVCEPAILHRIPVDSVVSVEREVFPGMADEGVLYAHASDAYWLDFGTIGTYLQANVDTLRGRLDEALPGVEQRQHAPARLFVDDGATIDATVRCEGAVIVAAGAVIGDGVVLGPDTAIGPGVTIRAGARVAGSVILDDAVVGEGAHVDDAVVSFGAVVPDGAKVTAGDVVGRADVAVDGGG